MVKCSATATIVNNMYKLDRSTEHIAKTASIATDEAELWHRRLGHTCPTNLSTLQKAAATGINFSGNAPTSCVTCVLGKEQSFPYKATNKRAENVLELIHSDVCGPMEVKSIGGARYFLTFVDDHSCELFVYILESSELESNDQVYNSFKDFKAFVENQTGQRIKALQSDNGTEYVNTQFTTFLHQHGIEH